MKAMCRCALISAVLVMAATTVLAPLPPAAAQQPPPECVGGSLSGRELNNTLVDGQYSTTLFVPANAVVRVMGTATNTNSIFSAAMPWRLVPFTSGTTPDGQSTQVDLTWTNGNVDQFFNVEFIEDGLFAFEYEWDFSFNGTWACEGLSREEIRDSLGEQDDNGESGDPINTGSGNFWDTTVDFEEGAALGEVLLVRTYNSMDLGELVDPTTGEPGIFGFGWTSTLDEALWPAGPDELWYRDPTGRQVAVTRTPPGDWVVPADLHATITDVTGGGWEMAFADGRTLLFDEAGRLLETTVDGGLSAEVVRDATTQVPEEVIFTRSSAEAARLTLTDTGDDGLIDTVTGPGGISRSYTYDAGRLETVSLPYASGGTPTTAETYVLDGLGRIEEIHTEVGGASPDVVRVDNTYDDVGRVIEQVLPGGDLVELDYAEPDVDDHRLTTVTHTGGGSSETYVYTHDLSGHLLSVEDPYGNDTSVTWTDRQLDSSTTRGGATTGYTRDAAGRLTDIALPDPDAPATSDRSEEVTYCAPTGTDPRPLTITDAAGVVTELAYGAPADPAYPCAGTDTVPTSITEAAGTTLEATTTITLDDGLPTEVVDPDGVTTRYRWDAARALLLAREQDPDPTQPGADVTFYAYDAAGHLRVERTPSGIETWFTHDASGRLTTQVGPVQAPSRGCTALADTCTFPGTAPSGPTRSVAYRLDGSVASETDAEGDVWTYERTYGVVGGGREEVQIRPDGSHRKQVYDAGGRMVSETIGDPAVPTELATTTFAYGPLGRLESITDPMGVETTFDYDADGRRTEVVDEDGELTETTYDGAGRVRSVIDPLGHETTYDYGPTGLLIEETDRTDETTTYGYDANGRLATVTDARGGITTYAYTLAGRLDSVTDPTSRTTGYEYDGAGRQVAQIMPSGAEWATAYDADGRVASETSPEGRVTSYTYDAAGRPLTESAPTTGTTTWTYDLRGAVLTETDATGGTITTTRDELGRPVAVTDPLGRVTTYEYDSRGNRTKRIDALSGEREWHWNLADQLTAEIDPLDRTTSYTYDGLGRLDVRTDGAGRTETYGYDEAGQVTSLTYASGTPTTFAYDEEGRRTQMVDATGTTQWFYNATGQLTGVDHPGARDLAFAWDLAGRRTVIDYPDGTRYRNRYDTDGRLSEVEFDNAGTWIDVAVNTYDDDGLLVEQDQGGGTGLREWTYHATTARLTSYSDTRGAVTTTTSLTHDVAGRVASETTGGTSTVYDYDDAGQLTLLDRSVGNDTTIAYDELGRRTSTSTGTNTTTYQWDAASQLTRRVVNGGNHNYQYDASGRRTREAWNGGNRVTQFFWGARGNLTGQRYTEPGTVTDIARSTRGDGTLAGLTTSVNSVVTETKSVVWDPTLPVPQPVWTGEPGATNATRAVYGPDLIRVTCPTGTSCTGAVPHDVRGSALRTTPTSAIVQDNAYAIWGDGGGVFTAGAKYGYRSELHSGDTIHLRARDYDPETGLFISPDPLDGVDGTTTVANPYHYADNDPLNKIDPLGLRAEDAACESALVPLICRNKDEIISGIAGGASGLICGAAAAPLGPVAAGAAAGVCAGAVTRGLNAYADGEDPWAAALDPGSIAMDAVIGGVVGGAFGAGAGSADDIGNSLWRTLTHHAEGIKPYSVQRGVTAGQSGSIQAHHLIEQRFANVMGGNTDDWLTVVLTRSEHQVFTNAWRAEIPYGAGTRNATRAQIEAAARRIYADYPEILRALGLA